MTLSTHAQKTKTIFLSHLSFILNKRIGKKKKRVALIILPLSLFVCPYSILFSKVEILLPFYWLRRCILFNYSEDGLTYANFRADWKLLLPKKKKSAHVGTWSTVLLAQLARHMGVSRSGVELLRIYIVAIAMGNKGNNIMPCKVGPTERVNCTLYSKKAMRLCWYIFGSFDYCTSFWVVIQNVVGIF